MAPISEAQAESSVDSATDSCVSSSDESVEGPSMTTVPSNTKELDVLVKVIYCYHPYWPLTERALQDLHLENAELQQQLQKLTSGAISSASSNSAASPKNSATRPPNPLQEYTDNFTQLG